MTHEKRRSAQVSRQYADANIYISFSTRDRELGEKLFRETKNAGLRAECDTFNIKDTKYKSTADSVANCDAFIAVMSRAYLSSPICKDELMFAFSLKKTVLLIYAEGVSPGLSLALKLAQAPSFDIADYRSARELILDIFADGNTPDEDDDEYFAEMPNGKESSDKGEIYGHTLTYDNGDTYTGALSDGIAHGRGRINYADGDSYEGDFDRGIPNGSGTYRFKSGDVYIGEIKNGIFEGRGSMYFADHNTYHGEFSNDIINGRGVLRMADGSVYEGDFKNGIYHGHGSLRSFSGDMYEGGFADGKFHGQGRFTSAKGEIYKGGFASDKRDGEGILYISPKKQFKVTYKKGRIVSKTKI